MSREAILVAIRATLRHCDAPPKRRIVVRIDRPLLARIDAVSKRLPLTSRASLIRAFCVFGVALAEEHAPPLGGADG